MAIKRSQLKLVIFYVSICIFRCFSRSDHLALHMKRHLWKATSLVKLNSTKNGYRLGPLTTIMFLIEAMSTAISYHLLRLLVLIIPFDKVYTLFKNVNLAFSLYFLLRRCDTLKRPFRRQFVSGFCSSCIHSQLRLGRVSSDDNKSCLFPWNAFTAWTDN